MKIIVTDYEIRKAIIAFVKLKYPAVELNEWFDALRLQPAVNNDEFSLSAEIDLLDSTGEREAKS